MIIPFKRPQKEQQSMSGEAFCIQCDNEWIAVAQTGTIRLECPNCHTMKGLFKYECAPLEGTIVRECNCGNQLFYITTGGHMCANCGTYQEY